MATEFKTWLNTLKVKQLKHLLVVKQVEIPTPMEKRMLYQLIMENIATKDDAENLLTNAPAPTPTPKPTPTPAPTRTSTTSSAPPQVKSKSLDEMSSQEIKYQALMMKQNPAQYRSTTGVNLTDAQIIAQANQLEQMAADPALRKQANAFNKLMKCMNEKQKDIWNKLYTGTYIPTAAEMKDMQPLLQQQKHIVMEVGAAVSPAMGNQLTPERIEMLLQQTATADPNLLVSMFSLAITVRKLWTKLKGIFGRATIPVLVVVVLVFLYFMITWTWRLLWWLLSFVFGSSSGDGGGGGGGGGAATDSGGNDFGEFGDGDNFGEFGEGDDDAFFDD